MKSALFALAVMLASVGGSAGAATVSVDVSVDFPDAVLPAFGLTEATTIKYSFLLDAHDTAYSYSAGSSISPSTELVAETDLFGYGGGAISEFSATVGTETFSKSDLQPFGISNSVEEAFIWFDEIPTVGGSPTVALRFFVEGGRMFNGNVLCKVSTGSTDCSLYSVLDIGGNFTPRDVVSTSISAVPLPASFALMLAGFAGLGWVVARRERR